VLAGAQGDARLARAAAGALNLWIEALTPVISRLLNDSTLQALIDVPALTHAIAAGFVGLELYEAADPAGAGTTLDTVEKIAVLVEVVEDLDPMARRMLRRKLVRLSRAAG
jgi:hypothetical protein